MYIYCMFCDVMFFFKQKTAYEMRISDWSSYVCSSDLTRCRDCPACCAEARRHEAGIQTFLLSTSGHRRRMSTYNAPLQDIRFALHDVLGAEALFARLGFTEATRDIVDAVLEESARLTETVLAPLNRVGDEVGCGYDKATGAVTTPPGFKEAYAQFVDGGWSGLASAVEFGGQGMPTLAAIPLKGKIGQASCRERGFQTV